PISIPRFDLHSLTLHSLMPALLMPKKLQIEPPLDDAGAAAAGATVVGAAPPGAGGVGTWAHPLDVIPSMAATLTLIFQFFMACPFGSPAWQGSRLDRPTINLATTSAVKAGDLEE